MSHKRWEMHQRFEVRISTMILIFEALLFMWVLVAGVVFGYKYSYPADNFFDDLVLRLADSFPFAFLVGFVVSLGYFAYSAFRRNPQFQFLGEAAICFLVVMSIPVH